MEVLDTVVGGESTGALEADTAKTEAAVPLRYAPAKPPFAAAPKSKGVGPDYSPQAVVREAICQNAAFTIPLLVMNTLSTIVACYGLLEDSTAVVIGSMLLAMQLGPISGIALALVDGDTELLRQALIAEIGGAVLVLFVSFTIGWIHQDIPITHEILARTTPNLLDLMIALAGGAAAAYATVSPRLNIGLAGAVLATALVPPLSACGICLARHAPALAWGGFLLFLANLVAIQFASSVVLWLSGYHAVTGSGLNARERRKRLFGGSLISLALLVLLAFVMATSFLESLEEQTFENSVRERLTHRLSLFPGVHLADIHFKPHEDSESVVAVLRSPYSFTPARVRSLETGLPTKPGKRTDLEVMSVIVKETSRDGYLNEPIPKPELSGRKSASPKNQENTIPAETEPGITTDAKIFTP